MRLRLPVALVLVVALAALLPLAHATPPDPTWISGLYDDADYDDVVLLVTSAAATTAPEPQTVEPVRLVAGVLVFAPATNPTAGALTPHTPRAPPLA